MCNTEKGCIFAPYSNENIGVHNEAIYIYTRWVYCMVIPFASLRCKGVIY